jgi:ABC-type microcin C transport system permease subunit YejB
MKHAAFILQWSMVFIGITYNAISHYEYWFLYLAVSTGVIIYSCSYFDFLPKSDTSSDFYLIDRITDLLKSMIPAIELEVVAQVWANFFKITIETNNTIIDISKGLPGLNSLGKYASEQNTFYNQANELIATTFTPPFYNAITFTFCCWVIATFAPIVLKYLIFFISDQLERRK